MKALPSLTAGFNDYGQLGDGSTASHASPLPAGLTGVEDVAAGGFHSLALKDGRVWTWGLGHLGQLGRGGPGGASTPAMVPGLTDVVAVAAGAFHSLALKSDGTVWAWGWNAYGQLGDGTTVDRWTPVRVSGITDALLISAGAAHNLVRHRGGTVSSWGFNALGQLGRGGSPLVPGRVAIGLPVEVIAAGGYHSLVVSTGRVLSWGWNAWGQLGDGTETNRAEPRWLPAFNLPFGTGSPVVSVAAGIGHSIVSHRDGTVDSWGLNNAGQLGRPTSSPSRTPGPVPGLSGVRVVVAGGYVSAALAASGVVSVWGWNAFGQVGDGTRTDRRSPAPIAGLAGSRAVSVGIGHTVAAPGVVFEDTPSPPR